MNLEWNARAAGELRRQVLARCWRLAAFWRREARDAVSGTGTSRPGQPPSSHTGEGRAGVVANVVASQPDRVVISVGTSVEHMVHQEFGTRRQAARPWLRRAILNSLARARSILH